MAAWGSQFRGGEHHTRRSGGLLTLVLAIALLFAVGVVKLPDWLPSLKNPFATETVDRTGPPLLKSLEDLSSYRAATGHFEVIVDIEKDAKYVPDWLNGERTLFVAKGSADGVVDFSQIKPENLTVSGDRRTVTVRLPRATLGDVRVDPSGSYVVDQDSGLLNKGKELFSGDKEGDRPLYIKAEERMRAAASDPASGILPRAEENTRSMLTSMLGSLGFTSVTVTFGEVVTESPE
ncbi:MAG TPA: DUF4230 domain-containing protein [Mycobacteriales bacterium]|jgi:hypothetical protein|nr:DUF4230 domain-containing protein [Mycobacteriales bacterium]